MIGRLNHVAIAVPDLDAAAALYGGALGGRLDPPLDLPAHGVTALFVRLPNTSVELLQPLGEASPLHGFMARNPAGGLHHVCYEVPDLLAARDAVVAAGARALGEPKIGAHGRPVLFLHPKDFMGHLIELEEVAP